MTSLANGAGPGIAAARRGTSLTRWNVETTDGVTLNVVETGDPAGTPVVFVHGISQSWRSWAKQLSDEALRARFRLIAMDLRGHGGSQGAQGAIDIDGRNLSPLRPDQYADGSDEGTAQLWANDIAAVVAALDLSNPNLVGWSYGGAVVLDYLRRLGGLWPVGKVVLLATSPVLRPPGAGEGGADLVFTPRAIQALLRTTPIDPMVTPPRTNTSTDVAQGLVEYVEACFADDTAAGGGRCQDVEAVAGFNLATPPDVRMAIIGRAFDNRDLLASLAPAAQRNIMVVTPLGDKVLQPLNVRRLWPSGDIVHQSIDREGHLHFWRNPDGFREMLLTFIGRT